MRITETRMLELAAAQVSDARDRAGEAQETLASGVRVARPSDDPAAWAQGARAAVRQTMSAGRGKAIGMAQSALQQTDGVLDTLSSSLTQLSALATQGANGTLDAAGRADVAAQIRALRDGVLQALDARGPDGSFLLSGSQGDVSPFTTAGTYQGDGTARSVQVGESRTSAGAVTGYGLTAAGGGAGAVDVVPLFDQIANALAANDVPAARAGLASIRQAMTQVGTTRSLVGEHLGALNEADDARQAFELHLAEQHAAAVEADPVTAAANLTRTSNVLDAARAAAQQIVSMLRGY